jgi:hypothetical protein
VFIFVLFTPPHFRFTGSVRDQPSLPQTTNMSYHHPLTSSSGESSDTTIRTLRIVLPPFSTVIVEVGRMCQDDVVSTATGVDIVVRVSPSGQPVVHDGG